MNGVIVGVQEYFTRFGYVMDVYLPRDKVNRSEHRGFGFVTFETDGAVLRIHAHGQHQIKCATFSTRLCYKISYWKFCASEEDTFCKQQGASYPGLQPWGAPGPSAVWIRLLLSGSCFLHCTPARGVTHVLQSNPHRIKKEPV